MDFHLVMKFGGAGLADGDSVLRAARIVEDHAHRRPIVVVSAHEGVTRALEACARGAASGRAGLDALRIRHKGLLRQLGLEPELVDRQLTELGEVLANLATKHVLLAEELDFVLSFGERISARIVAACLRRLGVEATPVDAFDLGLTTDSCHGRARPLPGVEVRLRESLRGIPGIPVVTGFLAKDGSGNLTTLGRNGTDLTAALVAHAVSAERLIFWKDVPGILTAHPELVPEARVIHRLSLFEASELAFHGAEVLHPRSLDPALSADVILEVRSGDSPKRPGTTIHGGEPSRGPVAITGAGELAGLEVEGGGGPAMGTLFALLHAHHVSPRFLIPSSTGMRVFAPPCPGLESVADELRDLSRLIPSLASVVCIGAAQAETGPSALGALEAAGVHPKHTIFGGPLANRAFLVDPADRGLATRALHECLHGARTRVQPSR